MVEIETPELRLLWGGDMDTRLVQTVVVLSHWIVICFVSNLHMVDGNTQTAREEEARFVARVKEVVSRGV